MTEDIDTSLDHLELRTEPQPIRKINKRGLFFVCTVLGVVIGGTIIVAFDPARVMGTIEHKELYNTKRKQTAEGLEKLPKSYADLATKPDLVRGADRGRLITGSDKTLNEPSPSSAHSNLPFVPNPEDEAERAERIRQMRLAAQARESGLFIRLSERRDRYAQAAATSDPTRAQETVVEVSSADGHQEVAEANALGRGVPPRNGVPDRPGGDIPSSQAHKLTFIGSKADTDTTNRHDVAALSSPYTIIAGSFLAASLVTGLNSDLPGMAIAQITESVFDSVTGEHLLIPQGSRLIGKYDSVIASGQKRALVVWDRIILPNGDSIAIDNLPAADSAGYAGLGDEVDLHSWQLLKGIGLATVFGVSSELALGNSNNALVQALRQSVQTNTNQAGQRMVERELNVQPTVTVRPGWPMRVIVAKDLVLKPYRDVKSVTME